MGLMDQLGQAAGGMMGGQPAQNPLLQAVTSLLGQNSNVGGLAGIVQAFQKNGLGDIVNSWLSTRSCKKTRLPMDASSWSHSASLSSGRARKTIRSRLQSVGQCESMPASVL